MRRAPHHWRHEPSTDLYRNATLDAAVCALVIAPPRHVDADANAPSNTLVTIKPNLKLMSNSERGKYYRRKRKLYTAELTARVAALRHQVRTLAASQQLHNELALGRRHTPVGSLAKLVREYCRQFEFGTPVITQSVVPSSARVACVSPQQLSFLHAAMESHVGFGEFSGIALLVDQWQRYSQFHSGIWFELTALEVVNAEVGATSDANAESDEPASPVIALRANLHVRITRETVEHVFPHLVARDNALVHELVGLEVAYPCVNHFYFTSAGTIARYDPYVDFLSALLAKIRSLKDVAHVLSSARIAKSHMIGVLDGDADANETRPSARNDVPLMSDDAAGCSSSGSLSGDDSGSASTPAPASAGPSPLDLDFILS